MIKYHEYKGQEKGIKVAITGAIHGNEFCGTEAIKRIIAKIEAAEIKLLKGSLTLIPISNPKAYEENTRFIDENLNRVFKNHDYPKTYEQGLACELTSIIGDCNLLIDLHSIHSEGFPFIMDFGVFSEEEENIKRVLGIEHFIHGWAEAYERSFPSGNREANSHTVSFMHSHGKMAIGVECGLHNDERSIDVAEKVILNALKHLGMIDVEIAAVTKQTHILIKEVFLREDNESLVKEFTHGDNVSAGEVITNRVTAKEDCLILFPRSNCPTGEEIFYTGELIKQL